MYRMLIVDDEKNERDCILYLLKNSGLPLEIREAEDGVAALALLKGWPAHILFTDVQMSRMDGLELIQKAPYIQIFVPLFLAAMPILPMLKLPYHLVWKIIF